jgi:hypothetical protein
MVLLPSRPISLWRKLDVDEPMLAVRIGQGYCVYAPFSILTLDT